MDPNFILRSAGGFYPQTILKTDAPATHPSDRKKENPLYYCPHGGPAQCCEICTPNKNTASQK